MRASLVQRVEQLRERIQNVAVPPRTVAAKAAQSASEKNSSSDLNYWQANNDIGVGTEQPWGCAKAE